MAGKAKDCVEPLQDKELRYGRVRIVESSPARVHARWDYQSCDIDYTTFGEFASEDFYFYPDGFGTRVLTLTSRADCTAETGEFIILVPQSGYPFQYLPGTAFDLLWPEGKAAFRFPCRPGADGQEEQWAKLKAAGKDVCLLHRVRFGKDDPLAAIQYSPLGSSYDLPGFPPFHDRARPGHSDVLGLPLALEPRLSHGLVDQPADPRDPGAHVLLSRTQSQAPAHPDRAHAERPGRDAPDEAGDLALADRRHRCRQRCIAALDAQRRSAARRGTFRGQQGRRVLGPSAAMHWWSRIAA